MRKVLLLSAAAGLLLMIGRAQAQDDGKAVIEQAIKASGGADNLAKLTMSRAKFKGTLEVMGMSFAVTGENWSHLPGRTKTTFHMDVMGQKIQVTEVLNKDKAWSTVDAAGNNMTTDYTGVILEAARESAYREEAETLLPLVKDKAYTLATIGEVKVNDRAAIGIKVSSKGHKDFNFYFDKQSHLLVKREGPSIDEAQKEINQEVIYSDYKAVDGVQRPMKMILSRDGKKMIDAEITEWSFPKKIEDSEFAKP